MTALAPDLDQARRFLTLLDEEAPAFTFQLATDDPKVKATYPIGADGKRRDPLARIINLPPDNLEALAIRNTNGAAVWVMINEGDGKGRTEANVTRARSVFGDLDGAPLDPVMRCELEPHCVVETSPGRFHAYWCVAAGLPLDRFEGVQRRIATMFNGDSICDLPRVMRLPGLIHAKDAAAPFMVRIVHQAARLPYPAADILRVFPPLEDGKPKARDNGRTDLPDPLAPDRLAELKAAHQQVFDRQYKSPSERDFALACLACKLGWPQEDAVALVRAASSGAKCDRADYQWRTVANAYAKAGGTTAADDTDRLERLVEQSTTDPGAAFEESAIDFLAALRARDPAAYERARARLKAKHVRVAALDQEIERRAPETGADGGKQGRALVFPEIEPWPESVNGAELLDAIAAHLQRFAIMPSDHAVTAAALWALHCHALDAAIHTPRLLVTSPTRECGKSQVMEWLAGVVPRPFDVIDPTGPTLFRPIEAHQPTVLIDEGDLVSWDERRDVRMVINAGHNRFSPGVPRCVGDDNDTRVFRVWAPLAYAMIGKPLDTQLSRSIVIPMRRMAPDQHPEHRRIDRDQGFSEILRKCARWAADFMDELRAADPEIPVTGRKANCWRPLCAIADLAGGEWPAKARAAALALSEIDDDAEAIGVQLLGHIKLVFDTTKAESIWTEDLLHHLHAMSEAPWCEYGRQRKPITPRQLATLLRPFAIVAGQVWKKETNKRGYTSEQFSPVWRRYLSASPLEATETASFSDFLSARENQPLADEKSRKATEIASPSTLAARNHLPGEDTAFAPGDDWQDVPPGAVLPPGCDIRLDLTSGAQQARKHRTEQDDLTLEDLDRMAGGDDDGWAEFDAWIKP